MTFTNLRENRFPGNAESIVLIHFCHTAIEFLCLGIGERYFRWICRQAIPQFFDQIENCGIARSEEHTSELQSPYDLVCRLLLEKKKKKTNIILTVYIT